jgi:hypothetical protein
MLTALLPVIIQYVASPIIAAVIQHLQGQGVVIAPSQVPTVTQVTALAFTAQEQATLAEGAAWLKANPPAA